MDEGGRVPLLAHHHLAADYDTAAKEDLRVTMVTLPVYGCIENTRTGKLLGSPFFPPLGSPTGSHLSYPMEGVACAATKTAASPGPTLIQQMFSPSNATRCEKPSCRKEHPFFCDLHNVRGLC